MLDALLMCLSAAALCALLTGAMRWMALSRGLLDVPNERSSHTIVTPRGGGLAIVLIMTVVLAGLVVLGRAALVAPLALICGGIAVAGVGFLDDRQGVSVGVRLSVHVAAAVWAVYWIGGLPPLQLGDHSLYLGWVGNLLAVVAVMWTLNLFNFMDGIDGIAASEAAFVALAGAVLGIVGGAPLDASLPGLVLAAACGGFLLWNWPPAKIFLGDVGSGYLGYAIAVLTLTAGHERPAALWTWLILGGVFFVDATVTLVRRTIRGERVHEAHRSHAYQWLARRWASHGRVTVAVLLVDFLWLLPCATFAQLHPRYAAITAAVAFAPLTVAVLSAGAGSSELQDPTHP